MAIDEKDENEAVPQAADCKCYNCVTDHLKAEFWDECVA